MLTSGRSHMLRRNESLGAHAATPGRRPTLRSSALRLALMMAVVALAIGCAAAGDIDDTQNAVILVIHSLESSSTHTIGDVITGGTILDDTLFIEFTAHLKAPITSVTSPTGSSTPTVIELQEVIVERYEVTFERTDGGSALPPGFTRAINKRVRLTPFGDDELTITSTSLTIVPATIKAQPPVSFLIDPGIELATNFASIQVTATIRFFGRTLGGDPVAATARYGIEFANWADPVGT